MSALFRKSVLVAQKILEITAGNTAPRPRSRREEMVDVSQSAYVTKPKPNRPLWRWPIDGLIIDRGPAVIWQPPSQL
jgi:hypothetical protein